MSRSVPPSELPEGDYFAVEAMVRETPLGRWFLEEHARRHSASDGASAVDALSKLSELSAGPIAERLNEILDRIAEARGGPANSRSARSADAGIAAIRQVVDKVREVAFELREAGRLDIYASALELYCTDMLSATDVQEGAVHRVSDLAGLLASVEKTIAEIVGRELPPEPVVEPPPVMEEAPSPASTSPQQTMAKLVQRSEADPVEAAVAGPVKTKVVPNRGTESAALAQAKPAGPVEAKPVSRAPVPPPPPGRPGEPSAMNEATPTTPREPALFQPTKPPTTPSNATPSESASSKLVKEARALFFVNPT
jgi:hypothetical protein